MRKILFIGGTHGNEGFAVEVLRRIERTYPQSKYGYDWIIGNSRALEVGERFTEKDLNRSAPGNPKSPYYEERRAAEIIALSSEYDAVIDLHGTSAECGLVKIIPYPTQRTIELAQAIPLERNVVWYSDASRHAGPIVQHTRCPGVEIECGPKTDDSVAKELYGMVAAILESNAAGTFIEKPVDADQSFFTVYGCEKGALDESLHDFELATRDKEAFYPFLSRNQYTDITCYKMHGIAPKEIELKEEISYE